MAMVKVGPNQWRDPAYQASLKAKEVKPSSMTTSSQGFPKMPSFDPRPPAYQPAVTAHQEVLDIIEFLEAVKVFRGSVSPRQEEQIANVVARKAEHRRIFW